ncbi:MAG: pyridoxal phosphate-dependent aminotransferase [Antricoccus sp.]
MPTSDRPLLNRALAPFSTGIFGEMSALAVRTGSLNLGQGFPDTDGPQVVLDAAKAAIDAGHNQYPPAYGIAELRTAIAYHQKDFYQQSLDPDTEILVTTGATEALAASLLALLEPGDEVIAFEPYYDSYVAMISLAGATRRNVTLRAPHFRPDLDQLRAAINNRTRLILLNSPHNPTGTVFSADELSEIARLAIEYDLIVITDEVYEHLTFDGARHIPLATLPGMAERTVTISSAGKTFGVTGWKIGWVCAPNAFIEAIRAAKQYLTYVSGAPFQPAAAVGLGLPHEYFEELAADLQRKRDRLYTALIDAGLTVFKPQGTYFMTVDVRSVGYQDSLDFCRDLPQRCGVVAIPSGVFYNDSPQQGKTLARFAFCKQDDVLDEAARRLNSLAGSKPSGDG